MTRNRVSRSLGKLLIVLIIVLWSGGPILLVFLSSIKEPKIIFDFPPKILFKPTFNSFLQLASSWPEFFDTLLNSVIITVGAAVLTVSISFFGGYAYSRYRSRALTTSAFFLILIRMIPPLVITIPLYPAVHSLKMFDSHFTLVFFYSTFFVSLGTWLMKSFIDQIPRDLEEAAFIDGASRFQTLWRIIFPLSAHGMMATSTFVIIFAWKEYLFALIFTTTRAKTAPLIISEMMSSVTGVQWGPVFAAATIQLIPLLVYIYLIQNVLVEGVTVGSVKG